MKTDWRQFSRVLSFKRENKQCVIWLYPSYIDTYIVTICKRQKSNTTDCARRNGLRAAEEVLHVLFPGLGVYKIQEMNAIRPFWARITLRGDGYIPVTA